MTCSPHLISFRGIPEGDKKNLEDFQEAMLSNAEDKHRYLPQKAHFVLVATRV